MDFFTILLAGLAAGFLGGLLGIGGGVILMPFLRFVIGLSPAYSAGTTIIAVFFTTLGGSYRHHRLGHVHLKSLLPVILSGALSTLLFSLVFLKLSERQSWIDLGVGLVFLFISLRILSEALPFLQLKQPMSTEGNALRGSMWKKVSIGSAAGILPGLLGIGTGAILVPAFRYLFRTSIKVAMGSSLVCFTLNAFISSLLKIHQDFVSFEVAVPVCIGTFIGSNLGAVTNRRFPSSGLKLIFGLLFLYVTFKFIFSFYHSQF